MQTQIISGNEIAKQILQDLKIAVSKLTVKPLLKIILVGNDPASQMYVKMKRKRGEEIGIVVDIINLNEATTTAELLSLISELNLDPKVTGLFVQLPLPSSIKEEEIIAAIAPEKDVDGMSPVSLGNLWHNNKSFASATPLAIITCLDYCSKLTGISLSGKHAVIINRSNIIGKPLGALLLQKDLTVTYCHSKTTNLEFFTKAADILISATGKAGMIKGNMLKPGAIVIDAGTSVSADGNVHGDVDWESVQGIASFVTPVPGGVGPLTITMLLKNTVVAGARNE
ncbi:MAG: bifunctional 5,10-methylenetetrahydrofolate dehydrogenase/5,10-methenyltetrahydrofolate cyclohydrolase [bacterium]